jgi:hypothetical protein
MGQLAKQRGTEIGVEMVILWFAPLEDLFQFFSIFV